MNITLRWRVALVVAAVTTLALAALLVFDRLVLVDGFRQLEDDEVRRDVTRVVHVVHVVDAERDRMNVLLGDWASWDDAYSYMQTRSPAFVTSNLPDDILDTMDLAALVFFDTSGRAVEGRTIRPDGKPGAIQELSPDWSMTRVPDVLRRANDAAANGGVMRTEAGTPLLFVAQPILRSDGSGAPRGTLVFARWLNADRVETFSKMLDTPIEFLPLAEAPLDLIGSDAQSDRLLALREHGEAVGYGVVRDINGQAALIIRTSQQRSVSALSTNTTFALVGSVLALGVLLAIAMTIALRAAVLGPLRRLRGEMVAVSSGSSDARVTVVGTDELAQMAEDVNRMLDRLTTSAIEHERLQDVVREQRDLAATALETMSEGLVAFDVQGFCIVCNPAAARLLGTTDARARGRHMTELLPGVAAPVGERPDGPQLLELNGRTLAVTRDRGGPPSATRHSVITLRDVTEVLDVERMRRDVISTVSHELRTPLTAIQATVEMLEGAESGPRNGVQANLVSLLTRNVARLRRILDDLLTLSALEGASARLDRDRLDIGVLANRVVEDLRPTAIAAGVAISCGTQGEVVAWADEARIRQVLENLIQNAIKFSSSDSGGVEVSVSGQLSEVRIAVLDHGVGIPASELTRVFERFYRSTAAPRNTQGTGLGLPIARMIVELHGGRIWLESDGRSGTVAYVTLPTTRPISGAASATV